MTHRNSAFFIALGLIAALSTHSMAQSGSRSSAPSGGASLGSATRSAPSASFGQNSVSPQISQPAISQPAFSQPMISQPVQGNFSGIQASEAMPLYQGGFENNAMNSINPMAQGMGQGMMAPSNPTAATGSSSPGIPSASLVDPIFQQSDPGSPYVVDHSTWNCLLSKYLVTDVQGINRFHYGSVTPADRSALKGYLQQLQAVDTRTLNQNEQLAYWFNLYNARTVEVVLDNYRIRSIRRVKQRFTDFVGPFDDEGAVTVLGKPLSLNDIESGIIRPVWNDPRIHYALNCASFGCPNLASRAWTANDLDGMLNQAACQYINSGRAVKRGLFGVRTSKIYKWYEADFGGSDEAVLNHLRQYANGNTLRLLNGQRKIRGHFYDWSLNDARIQRRRLLEPLIR